MSTDPQFPDAYRRAGAPGEPETLPDLSRWLRLVLLLAALLVLVSWPVWEAAKGGTDAQVERILQLLEPTAGSADR